MPALFLFVSDSRDLQTTLTTSMNYKNVIFP